MKLFNVVEKILLYVIGAIFIVIFAVNLAEIINRTVTGKSILWAVDFSQMMFVWVIMLGASIAMYRGEHVLVEMIVGKFPHKLENTVALIIKLLVLVFYVVLVFKGFKVAQNRMGIDYVMLGWPTGYTYMALPVSAIFMIFFLLPSIWTILMRYRDPNYNKTEDNDAEEDYEKVNVIVNAK